MSICWKLRKTGREKERKGEGWREVEKEGKEKERKGSLGKRNTYASTHKREQNSLVWKEHGAQRMAAFCLLPQSPSFHSLFPECWILLPTSKTGFPAYSRSSSHPYGTLPHINLLKSLSCTIPFNRYSLLGRYGLESKTKEFLVDPVFIRCTLSTSSFHYHLTFTLPLSQIGLLCLQ